MKKQRFITAINDTARSKPLIMSFARRHCMQTPEGFGALLTELEECKTTVAYREMVKQSEKRTE